VREILIIDLWCGERNERFGLCYHCQDGEHKDCIGVPCDCECPGEEELEEDSDDGVSWLGQVPLWLT